MYFLWTPPYYNFEDDGWCSRHPIVYLFTIITEDINKTNEEGCCTEWRDITDLSSIVGPCLLVAVMSMITHFVSSMSHLLLLID